MNKKNYKKKQLLRTVVFTVFYIIAIVIIFYVFIKPRFEQNRIIQAEHMHIQEKLKEYYKFEEVIKRFEGLDKEIDDVIAEFYSNIIPRENLQEKFLENMEIFSRKAGLKISQITHEGSSFRQDRGYEKHMWNLVFTANFEQLSKFFYELENSLFFFAIENIRIETGAMESSGNNVNLSIYTVIPVPPDTKQNIQKYDIFSSTAILGMPHITYNLTENLKLKRERNAKEYSLSQDPFAYEGTILPKKEIPVPVSTKQAVEPPPTLNLSGVIWDDMNPQAIINGELLQKGGSISGAEVTRITKTSATFKWKNKTFTVYME